MNRKLKKSIVVFLLFALILCLITGCHKQGNIENVQIEEYETELFTEEEMDETIKVLEKEFKDNYDDCELLTIVYCGDDYIQGNVGTSDKERYQADKIIEYKISFKSNKETQTWKKDVVEIIRVIIGYKDNQWIYLDGGRP